MVQLCCTLPHACSVGMAASTSAQSTSSFPSFAAVKYQGFPLTSTFFFRDQTLVAVTTSGDPFGSPITPEGLDPSAPADIAVEYLAAEEGQQVRR